MVRVPSPRLGAQAGPKAEGKSCHDGFLCTEVAAVLRELGLPQYLSWSSRSSGTCGTFFYTCFTSGSPQELWTSDKKVRGSSLCTNSAQGWGRAGAFVTEIPADKGLGPEKHCFFFVVEDSVHCCGFAWDCPVLPPPFMWVGFEAPFCSTDLCVWF